MYFVSKDNHQELKYGIITGIFETPSDVEDGLTEYPLPEFMWGTIKDKIVDELKSRPHEDPINNSEPDYALQNAKQRRERKTED